MSIEGAVKGFGEVFTAKLERSAVAGADQESILAGKIV